jgi:hypothetical protein
MNPYLYDPMGRHAPRAVRNGALAVTVSRVSRRVVFGESIRSGTVRVMRLLGVLRDGGFRFAGAPRPSAAVSCCAPTCCARA